MIRRDGNVIESKIGEYSVKIKNENFSFSGISIPWGDVYTSFQSTKIPNAEVYLGLSGFQFAFKSLLLQLTKLLGLPIINSISKKYISKFITGPDKSARDSTKTYIWGRVENSKNEVLEEVYQVMEGYNLTAKGASDICIKLLNDSVKPGTYTPSLAFGSDYLELFVIQKII